MSSVFLMVALASVPLFLMAVSVAAFVNSDYTDGFSAGSSVFFAFVSWGIIR